MLADEDNPLDADLSSGGVAPADPQVVVVYRSRGVPWLLVPPLLLLSAVVAVIGFRRFQVLEFPRSIAAASLPDVAPSPIESQPAPPVAVTVYQSPEAQSTEAARKGQISFFPLPDLTARPQVPGEAAPTTEVTVPPEVAPVETAAQPVLAGLGPLKPATVGSPVETKREAPQQSMPTAIAAPTPVPAVPPALASATLPPPAETVGTRPTPIGEVPLDPPAKRDAVGFDPEAANVVAREIAATEKRKNEQNAPKAEPKPNAAPLNGAGPLRVPSEAMRADIQREAEQRLADRAGLEEAKPDLLNPDPLEVEKRRHQLYAATRRLAAKDRVPFHDDLRRVLTEKGNRAGPDVQQLANLYGRDTMPEILGTMNRDLVGVSARLPIPARIERMRRWGVPESIILDDLVEIHQKNFNGRNGPRTKMEAWVFAARDLLASPPKPATPAGSAAGAAPARTATAVPAGN